MQPPYLFNITNQTIIYCLEIYSNWFLKCQPLNICLLSTKSTPTPDQYHKSSCILLIGNLFKYIYKLTSIDLPLVEHQWNPICGQYQRQALLYFMVMNSKIFINCQAFNSPLLGIKKISIPIEYHKTKCILLLGNLFQSIYKLASIDLRLVEHQCNLHLCSISQNKLYFTARKIIPIYF